MSVTDTAGAFPREIEGEAGARTLYALECEGAVELTSGKELRRYTLLLS